MCFKNINNIPYNKKRFLTKHLLDYKTLIGNKLMFTSPESYEYVLGLNFVGNSIYKIEKSLVLLKRALSFLHELRKQKGTVLFVGTRHDLRKIVQKLGVQTSSPYVNHKWLKGLLTNWETSSNSVKFYKLFLKKLGMRVKQQTKLKATFSGLEQMNKLPDALFILDINTDQDALKEAKRLNIPIIALIDTNLSWKDVDYPIPGNSDSILSIILFSNLIISSMR